MSSYIPLLIQDELSGFSLPCQLSKAGNASSRGAHLKQSLPELQAEISLLSRVWQGRCSP
jgi:uncharacterized protein YukE